ncbi:hypothetical protein AB685_26120 [Bacillus sp. LL01]|uniref:hypothetical protein n=1 Tax=Bacillus sp. LL01 TaxID=1665556 RepID=UPI00064D6C08|nr:hypothetical protein [Bacillus sp. LL01]KMJ55654.1 hypothetical protein AB685_26120 [Bacillus sp. LL01]
MVHTIKEYEEKSRVFNPSTHIKSRIQEMEGHSAIGAEIASTWKDLLDQRLVKETYPVIHPIGQETFSLYADYPTGVFEYALDIDGTTALIKKKRLEPSRFSPSTIIDAVDQGNLNQDQTQINPNHKNPVMVLQSHYLTDNKPYCINGNHRINEAFKREDQSIEVYVFKELEFVPFFYDNLSKAMYFLELDYHHVVHRDAPLIKSERGAFVYDFRN